MGLLRRLWDARKPPVVPAAPAPRRDASAAFRDLLARSRVSPAERRDATDPAQVWRLPQYLPGVLPGGATRLAMDQAPAVQYVASPFGYQGMYQGMWSEGIGFMGYPYLAELTQRPEYRRPSEVIAEEMTRKWLKLKAVSNEDKQVKIDELEKDLKRFNIREHFYQLALLDGFFGRAQLHINVGGDDDDALMQQPLTLRPETFRIGSLKGFRVIDPTWTAPNDYNAIDPMSPAFYRPQTWFIMGRIIHASRLLTLISRPMPDILKPVYNFGGLALSQMLKPYVDNWLRTRQSVSDLLQAFTVFVLETDMAAFLQGGNAPTLFERAELFANLKNNLGTMLIDKDKEGFKNVTAPLAGLDHLQAQAQEHMASVSGEPLVKMTGITPSGLNATSDGEIRVFYDTIHARQGRVFSPLMETILEILQLNRYGEIDRNIVHEWVPLYQLDEAGQASVQKTNADTDAVLIETNVITPDEARTRLRSDPASPYAGLEGEAPEPVTPEMGEIPGINADPAERIATQGAEGTASGANRGDAADAEFHEADHPRDDDGKFGAKGHGGSKAWQSTLAAYTAAHGGKEPGYSSDETALKRAIT